MLEGRERDLARPDGVEHLPGEERTGPSPGLVSGSARGRRLRLGPATDLNVV